jgi:alpha-tubulin suppressor-like RCC1 family protein
MRGASQTSLSLLERAPSSTPIQLSSLTGITAIATGFSHTVVLRQDGTIWTWGYNNYGQLGDGTTSRHLSPACCRAR